MLAVVWGGAAAAIVLKFVWVDAPKWLAAAIAISLGWVAVIVFPQLDRRRRLERHALVLAGGLCYTVGGLVYALRRPDPLPAVFGYHEVFHVLVVAAVVAPVLGRRVLGDQRLAVRRPSRPCRGRRGSASSPGRSSRC